jgi:hypothetical protein
MKTTESITSRTRSKRIILFPQDKGGIGKSFIATLLYDYLSEQGAKLKPFDLDHANSTFQRFVQEAEFLDTDVDTDKLAILDAMVNALESHQTVLVDNRAAGGTKILQYIRDSRLTEVQEVLNFDLVFVIIGVDDKDAISQAADVLEEHGKNVRWLVARNYRDSARLPMFDETQTRKKLAGLGAIEIDVPCLSETTRNKLQLANLTVGKGRKSEKLPILDRSRCEQFHARMSEEFKKAKGVLVG